MANTDYVMLRVTGAYIKRNTETAPSWRNFAGRPTRFNPKGGNRDFTIDLYRSERIELGNDQVGWKPATVDDLIAMGWKVKVYDPRDQYPDSEPSANLKIVVGFHDDPQDAWKDPAIYEYIDDSRVKLDIDTVGMLDDAWIDSFVAEDGHRVSQCKLKCGHSQAMVAYLNELHVHVRANTRSYDEWD